MLRKTVIGIFMALLWVSVTWALESPLTITDMIAEPTIVNSCGKILISCRVSHSKGPLCIKHVAATVLYGRLNTSIPGFMMTEPTGIMSLNDGIFSLEIKAADIVSAVKIVFHAGNNERNEIDSEPILLIIQK